MNSQEALLTNWNPNVPMGYAMISRPLWDGLTGLLRISPRMCRPKNEDVRGCKDSTQLEVILLSELFSLFQVFFVIGPDYLFARNSLFTSELEFHGFIQMDLLFLIFHQLPQTFIIASLHNLIFTEKLYYFYYLHPECSFPSLLTSQPLPHLPSVPHINSSWVSPQKMVGLSWISTKHGSQIAVRLNTFLYIKAVQGIPVYLEDQSGL